MWKITTRGFTLEEVLIMAAMNLLTSAKTAAKREDRPSQNSYPSLQSRKRTDQKLASRARDFSRRTRQATAYSNVPTTTV